jgi:DNA mismatch repair protein MutS
MEREDFLWMDRFTIRNIELLHTGYENGHSLIKVMDNTVSAMGARLLHRWMLFPLKDLVKINERLDAVSTWIVNPDLRKSIAESIKRCGDVERLVSKIPLKKISPREVLQLAKGLEQIGIIQKDSAEVTNPLLQQLAQKLAPCLPVMERIFQEINEAPPAAANKGNVFNAGINAELDELRNIASGGKEFLNNIQQREAEITGINSLKINFNNVFGYYLEVTNSQKHKVPSEWIRKQTLANAERYITPELKTYEEKIMGAEDKILAIELDLYDKLLQYLQEFIAPMQLNGHLLAHLDCLICFAENAIQYQYKKPDMHNGALLELKDSRHPVIEKNLPAGESYVSNDIVLDPEGVQVIILTGPNMSGKSALLRQTALITLMAHMGSFVPASSAKIPLTDKIFTRVGASDNLSGGESTFMVEMNETASIINNISARSLILLDEIGRGTSTYDGISIAWSIVEHLHSSPAAPKTLFATHYHELNELEAKLPRVKNYHITNKELGNKIIFLRKLAPGGSIHSFGIHVARMAGMPPSLIARANEILEQLEDKQVDEKGGDKKPRIQNKSDLGNQLKELSGPKMQLSIFDAHSQTFQDIRKRLEETDINQLTPVEALMKLNEIKNMLK